MIIYIYIHISSGYPVYPHHTILVAYIGNLNWRYLFLSGLSGSQCASPQRWKRERDEDSAPPRTFGSADLRNKLGHRKNSD